MARPKKENKVTTETNVVQPEIIPTVKIQEETKEVELKTVVLSGPNLTTIVNEVFYLGSLGGVPTKGSLPRLKSTPYMVKIDLRREAYLTYTSKAKPPVIEAQEATDTTVISTPDPLRFIQAVLDVGSKGGMITPKKAVQGGMTLIVQAVVPKEVNLQSNPVMNVLRS
jgi:hypothetical protein